MLPTTLLPQNSKRFVPLKNWTAATPGPPATMVPLLTMVRLLPRTPTPEAPVVPFAACEAL
ncbi:hypothetical protein D3C71_1842240 [compost metagenome]